ncbi:uncharacterized protein PRD47_005339 isoform 2-T2 [Ara ararauna]
MLLSGWVPQDGSWSCALGEHQGATGCYPHLLGSLKLETNALFVCLGAFQKVPNLLWGGYTMWKAKQARCKSEPAEAVNQRASPCEQAPGTTPSTLRPPVQLKPTRNTASKAEGLTTD